MNDTSTRAAESSRDEPDSLIGMPKHPAAALAGAVVAGAATGAVVGTGAGPVGTVVGAAFGAVAGAMGGDAIANSVEQVHDADRWREHYARQDYVREDDRFEDFGPAYEYGTLWRQRHMGRAFEDVEPDLASGWESARGASRLDWSRARHAARDAWGTHEG